MNIIWNWVRDSKNLAVLVALGGAISYLISLAFQQNQQPPTAPQSPVVVSPIIHIENNPSNTESIPPQAILASAPLAPSVVATSQTKTSPKSISVQFPIRRNAGVGIPLEFLPELSITVASVLGNHERMEVELESELWGRVPRSFSVGSPPIDITFKGRPYRLSVERADIHSVTIVLNNVP